MRRPCIKKPRQVGRGRGHQTGKGLFLGRLNRLLRRSRRGFPTLKIRDAPLPFDLFIILFAHGVSAKESQLALTAPAESRARNGLVMNTLILLIRQLNMVLIESPTQLTVIFGDGLVRIGRGRELVELRL
jgi:hypothetical protein